MAGRRIGQRARACGPDGAYVPLSGYGAKRGMFCVWAREHDGRPPRDDDTFGRWVDQAGGRLPALPSDCDSYGELMCHQSSVVAWADGCFRIVTSSKQAQAGIAREGKAAKRSGPSGTGPGATEAREIPSQTMRLNRWPGSSTIQACDFVAAAPPDPFAAAPPPVDGWKLQP
jgi:hypothetical protein